MTVHDVYLLSPELALAGMGAVVILLDLFVRRKGLLSVVALAGLTLPLVLTILLLIDVRSGAERSMSGILNTFVVDEFSLYFKFLIIAMVGLLLLASTDYVSRLRRFQGEYYGLILFSATGMMLLASTTELISIYISLELVALPLAGLIALLRDSKSTEAGIKFLLLSAMSSALLLYGLVLVYGFTGTTQLPEIARLLTQDVAHLPFGSYPVLMGTILIVAGFGFKVSAVPFQMWTPDVYEGSPTPITAYLSVASKAAGFAVLLRLFYGAFGSVSLDWSLLFAVLAALSMTIGNLMAIAQNSLKRLLAYSTIAHAGYMLVGLAAVSARMPDGNALIGPGGVLFYLAVYGVSTLAAFFAVIVISNKVNSDKIDDYAGVGRISPWVAGVLAIALISLIGLPPAGGFMGKLFLFNAAISAKLVWLAVIGVVNSVVSAYYYLRIIRVMYLKSPVIEGRVPSSISMRVALALSGVGVLFLGVIPAPLLDAAHEAVRSLVR